MTVSTRYLRIAERVSNRLKLRQLRLLVEIAQQASILHAARILNISQPAATKLLKDMEADFGFDLFERTNRGTVPTPYGAALVRHGKLILAQIGHAAQELDDLREGAGGRVKVGTVLTASADLLPRAVLALRAKRPGVTVEVREGPNDILMPMLRDGDIDMVVGRLPKYRFRSDFSQIRLYDEAIWITARAGHPLATHTSLDLADLRGHPWIFPTVGTTLRRQVETAFLDAGNDLPVVAVESVSAQVVIRTLMLSDMIGVLPESVLHKPVTDGDLVHLPCALPSTLSPVGISVRRDAHLSPAAQAFSEALHDVAAGIIAERRAGA